MGCCDVDEKSRYWSIVLNIIRIEGEKIVLRSVDSSDIDTILLWENSNNEPLYGLYEE